MSQSVIWWNKQKKYSMNFECRWQRVTTTLAIIFSWHKFRNTTKSAFFHRLVASYIRTVFLSWKLHQYPCEFIFTVPLFTELGKFDGVLLTWGRVYKPMQCICLRACVCGPGGFCHLAEQFLQNSHILTWRMLIRGRPSDELGCDG